MKSLTKEEILAALETSVTVGETNKSLGGKVRKALDMLDKKELEELMRQAAKVVMTPEQVIQQKISWVYGQCRFRNPGITRETVERIVRHESKALRAAKWILRTALCAEK